MKLCVSIDLIVVLRKEHKNARDIYVPSKPKDIKLLLNDCLVDLLPDLIKEKVSHFLVRNRDVRI